MIELAQVTKIYLRGKTRVKALSISELRVPGGQFLSVMGASGSGKSTLLNLVGALDLPTSGSIRVDGAELSTLDDRALSEFRRARLGFVFQFFNLLPTLTALENAMLPGLLAGEEVDRLRQRARALLDSVGLDGRADHRPDELSGGEMQRVAIARALLSNPALLLADEPTGNLDSRSGADILQLIRRTSRERKLTVIMVTHNQAAAEIGDRVIRLADGSIVGDERMAGAA